MDTKYKVGIAVVSLGVALSIISISRSHMKYKVGECVRTENFPYKILKVGQYSYLASRYEYDSSMIHINLRELEIKDQVDCFEGLSELK